MAKISKLLKEYFSSLYEGAEVFFTPFIRGGERIRLVVELGELKFQLLLHEIEVEEPTRESVWEKLNDTVPNGTIVLWENARLHARFPEKSYLPRIQVYEVTQENSFICALLSADEKEIQEMAQAYKLELKSESPLPL